VDPHARTSVHVFNEERRTNLLYLPSSWSVFIRGYCLGTIQPETASISFNLIRRSGDRIHGIRVNLRVFSSTVPTIRTLNTLNVLSSLRTDLQRTVLLRPMACLAWVQIHRLCHPRDVWAADDAACRRQQWRKREAGSCLATGMSHATLDLRHSPTPILTSPLTAELAAGLRPTRWSVCSPQWQYGTPKSTAATCRGDMHGRWTLVGRQPGG
jgi:hypothetical protein